MAKKLTTAGVLRKARGLVAKGWCQGPFAKDRKGKAVEPYSTKACRWCASGAIIRAVGIFNYTDEAAVYGLLSSAIGEDPIFWNEVPRRTQAQVLRAFDKAIKLAEKSGHA